MPFVTALSRSDDPADRLDAVDLLDNVYAVDAATAISLCRGFEGDSDSGVREHARQQLSFLRNRRARGE